MPPTDGSWIRAARRLRPRLVRWRRGLHRIPELSNEERETRQFVCAALDELSIPYRTYDGFLGVLAIVGEGRPGPVVALRADMDALPIQEATRRPWRSRAPGRMHACGHDVHMACLLGAGAMLKERARTLRGPVKLLFQPAEEEGARGGAAPFLERGAFLDPTVDFVVGQHVGPELPVGTIGWRKGASHAAADRIQIRVIGTGSHAAAPHLGRDPVLVASEIVVGLQAIVSRITAPTDPVVVTIGSFHGGTRHNVIPDEVELDGTVRTLRESTRARVRTELTRRVRKIAESLGARAEVRYLRGYPPTINSPSTTEVVAEALGREFGEAALREVPEPFMGAEDFSRYLERVPGTFLRLGVAKSGPPASLHSARFDPPEAALPIGAAALACAAAALQATG